MTLCVGYDKLPFHSETSEPLPNVENLHQEPQILICFNPFSRQR